MKVTARRVWAVWAVATALVLVTYSRVPVARLYHVSRPGWVGGVGRALVSIALCATAMSGMISSDDLDFRLVNLLPVVGVVLAVIVSLSARWPGIVCGRSTIVAIAVMGVLALPWLAAHAGFSLPGRLFMTDQLVTEAGEPWPVPAVHLGDHHGLYAGLLAATALALWRVPRSMPDAPGRRMLQGYLALLVSYGLVNMAQDFWGEQIAARGWTNWTIPDALEPRLSLVWAVIAAGTVVAYLLPRPGRSQLR